MRRVLEVALGIMTSIGGFLDAGALATSIEAGTAFGYSLLWAVVLGTIAVIFLVEMAGRLAAVSGHSLVAAVRERFGLKFFLFPLITEIVVDFFVLGSELGGVCFALQLLTGVSFQVWAMPVALGVWFLLWRATFAVIENGTAILGLITIAFVVAAFKLHPPLHDLAAGLVPKLPGQGRAHYLYIAVSILGALISPYLFYFYSSGAIEDKWSKDHITVNKFVAVLGMGFGSAVSIGVLIVAAVVLYPKGVKIENYNSAAGMLDGVFGHAGTILFALSLGIACLGASLEVSLDVAYIVAQAFGWNWGESKHPLEASRFSLVYTVFIFLAIIPVMFGFDPLQLTIFSMALTAAVLPIVVTPFLVLMNDSTYVGKHRNGVLSNTVVVFAIVLAFLLAVVALPLQILGSR